MKGEGRGGRGGEEWRGGEGRGREERRGRGGEAEGNEEIRKWKERRGEGMGKHKMRMYGATKGGWKGVQENFSFVCFCMHAHVQSPVVAFLIIRTGDMKEAMCIYVCILRGSKGLHRASLPQPYPFNCSGSDFEALLAGELGTQEGEGGEEEQD